MNVVFAKTGTSMRWAGGIVRLSEGAVWAADDPFVRAHPEMFADAPSKVNRTVPVVEQATKAPGEKRAFGRATA